MATKPRLPNNVIAGLEDILALCRQTWPAIEECCERAETKLDPVMLAKLNRVTVNLASIERKARAARGGKYEE